MSDVYKIAFETMADDVLCALAGQVGTPEETYRNAPWLVGPDIERLRKQNDYMKEALEAVVRRYKVMGTGKLGIPHGIYHVCQRALSKLPNSQSDDPKNETNSAAIKD